MRAIQEAIRVSGSAEMLWIVTAASLVAAIAVLMVLLLSRRRVVVDELGFVSDRWIAEHRADSL
jgi:hypothetical protein